MTPSSLATRPHSLFRDAAPSSRPRRPSHAADSSENPYLRVRRRRRLRWSHPYQLRDYKLLLFYECLQNLDDFPCVFVCHRLPRLSVGVWQSSETGKARTVIARQPFCLAALSHSRIPLFHMSAFMLPAGVLHARQTAPKDSGHRLAQILHCRAPAQTNMLSGNSSRAGAGSWVF